MHGRLKVKTTEEQQAAKLKEQEKKLKIFSAAWDRLIEKRKNQEYDKEVLELSGQILSKIPDVQTLWNIRKETFLFLKENLESDEYSSRCKDELTFTEHCLQMNPKSYGCWEHRCWVLDHSVDPDWRHELTLCNQYLTMDERNFHCWDYRRFIVKRSNTSIQNELTYTTDKISANFSNFSSWHYRSKLLPQLYPDTSNAVGIKQDVVLSELNMVQSAFFTDPNDQSAWFYHRWLLGKADIPVRCDLFLLLNSRRKALIRFTKPVKRGDLETTLHVSNLGVHVKFQPLSLDFQASKIWFCDMTQALEVGCRVELKVGEMSYDVSVTDASDHWVLGDDMQTLLTVEFSQAAQDVLLNELDMLRQLHELEPDNKWTMLTIISLVRNLNPQSCLQETEAFLSKLKSVDEYRSRYYEDMRSKYVIEDVLRSSLSAHSTSLYLNENKLTSLYHPEYMLLMTEIDVSGNRLTSLKGMNVLQRLRVLKAGRNCVTSLSDLGVLTNLECLDVSDNKLIDEFCFHVVTQQPKLTSLNLSGNPVVEKFQDQFTLLMDKFTI